MHGRKRGGMVLLGTGLVIGFERMVVGSDNAWDVVGPTPPPVPDKKFPPQETEFILNGRWQPAIEVDNEAFREFRKKHGLSI